MRVIGGEFRSRRLKSLPGLETRPTPDRLRETLFNILAPRIDGCVFVDAYAGTGAVGIEALSRGARRAIFIERGRAAAGVIRENLDSLGLGSRGDVRHGKSLLLLDRIEAGIVFLDPPYELEKEFIAAMELLSQRPPELVIVQHSVRFAMAAQYGPLRRARIVKQGDNALSFYEPADPSSMESIGSINNFD